MLAILSPCTHVRLWSWASRVNGWVYDPWTTGPDLTAVGLDPPVP